MRIYKAVVGNDTTFVRAKNIHEARRIVTERLVRVDLATLEEAFDAGKAGEEILEGMPDGSAPDHEEDC